jgi:hypothetical protein
VNQGNRCGRLFGLVALTIAALVAATAANADPGVGGIHPASPTLPGVPGVPAVPALPGVAVGAKPSFANARAKKGAMTQTITVKVFVRTKAHPHWRPLHKGVHVVLRNRVTANAGQPAPNCNSNANGVNCVNLPLDGMVTNLCAGQEVLINPGSTWHLMNAIYIDLVSGSVTQKLFTNWQNVSGVSVDGSTPYSLNDTFHEYDYTYPIAGTTVSFGPTIDENNELISHGPLPNQVIHVHDNDNVSINLANSLSPQVSISDSAAGPDGTCKG